MKRDQKLLLACKLSLFLLLALTGTALDASHEMFRVTATGSEFTEIEFDLTDYEFTTQEHDGITYQRLYHPEAGYIFTEGLPELPILTAMLMIPDYGDVSIEVLGIDKTSQESDILLFPSQGPDLVISEETGFLYDREFYKKDISYPAKLVDIGSPIIMRDFRAVSIAIFPFSYNPGKRELTIHHNVKVRVSYNRLQPGENELNRRSDRISRSFENIYRAAFLNYDQFRNPDLEYQARSIIVIYHHSPLLEPTVNQFVDWKRDKGFEITATNTSALGSSYAIKNYIQNAYDTWENPPEYIILIGGGSGSFSIPKFYEYSADGDHPYGLLEGNDDISDAFVGRFPIATSEQLVTIWNKLRNYEKEPYLTNTDWYEHALLVGDATTPSGISPSITMRFVKELIEYYNENFQFTTHYTGSATTVINNAFNQGISFFPYRGYIGMSGWTANASSLNNGLMLPNCFFISCATLSFSNSSNTESVVNMGTPVTPKGAIAAIGMTTGSTRTAFNNAYVGSFMYGIFAENIRTMGETLARGKLFLHQNWDIVHPAKPPIHSQKASLMGDPSADIWAGLPKIMNVAYDESLPIGANYIDITVTDDDSQPIENAWVTIRQVDGSNEVLFETDYTDENGHITHIFDSGATGTVKVTVTKPDYIPHLGTFSFDGDPSVALDGIDINGETNAGNSAGIDLTLKNYMSSTATNVSGTLSIDSEFIEVTQAVSTYPDIPAAGTGDNVTTYQVSFSPDTPSGYRAYFDLEISEGISNNWLSRFVLIINNGHLVVEDISFSVGNVIEPAQNAEMYVTLHNYGNLDVDDVYGTLSGEAFGFTILEPTAYFGNIAAGENATNSLENFEVAVSGTVIPGTVFNLEIDLYNSDGFAQTVPFNLSVGTVTVDDPLGPDSFGYICFDDGDDTYLEAPVYDWIEIAPSLGGSGVNTGLQSDHSNVQQVTTMDLPFTFRFYDIDYDEISICANGWISFGITEQATFRNYRLPGPMGPSPIVAAFWDNLSLASGAVYTYYDESSSIFVIQWQNAVNRVGSAEETFQIILYDPSVYLTPTGNGDIKIQYKVFNNMNNMTGPEWGNYCTVGLEDHTGTVGLEYTFGNQYPTAARPLGNETAILFTTGGIDYENAYIAIDNFSIVGVDNNIPEFGDIIDISMTLINLGGEIAQNVAAEITSNDQYITILDDYAFFGTMGEEETITVNNAFTVEIADNVPDMHRAQFILTATADDNMTWTHTFNFYIQAPELDVLTPLIYDPAPGGNNNGVIDPGETLTLYLPIMNAGSASSPEIDFNITTDTPLVTINSISNTEFLGLFAGDVLYPEINITVDETISVGTEIAFDYVLETGNYIFSGEAYTNVGGLATAQLGSGTATNSTTDGAPINIWYRSLRGQMVYTADELSAAGINNGGAITDFGFYVTSPPQYALPNFIIRMKHTTATNASSHDNGPFETVYFTNSYMPTAGDWDMIELDTPFLWNGEDNILVDTAFAQVPSWNSSGQLRIYSVPNGYRFVRSDGSDQTNATTTTTSSNKPQAMIVLITSSGDTEVVRPENLTAEYSNSQIHLEWNPPTLPDLRSEQRTRSATAEMSRENNRDNRTLLGYNIYRNGNQINDELIEVTEYYDPDVEPLTDYYYYVTALFTEGESQPSNIAYIQLANRVATPEFTPPGGYYNTDLTVEITTDTEDAVIYYTLDGSEPDESSILYELPIELTLGSDITIKAKGYCDELLPSDTASADYFMTQIIPTPEISPEGGTYYEPLLIEIELPEDIWNIYYTTDGSIPNETSELYIEPFTINVSTTVRARGFADDWIPSETATTDYAILNPPQNLVLESSIDSIELSWEEPLTMSGENSLPDWYNSNEKNIPAEYSLKPTTVDHRNRSTRFSREITSIRSRPERREIRLRELIGYNVYRAIGDESFSMLNDEPLTDTYYEDSDLAPGNYQYYVTAVYSEGESNPSNTVNHTIEGVVANPEFSPEPGSYEVEVEVTLYCDTDDAIIYYTLDGNDPDENSTVYADPIYLDETTTIKAIAMLDGWISSEIVSGVYEIEPSSVEDETPEPLRTELIGAYPNPFNPTTTLAFTLDTPQRVTLEIYNIAGRKVTVLLDSFTESGRHNVFWDGLDSNGKQMGSGVYFYRMKTADYLDVKKMILLK